MPRGRPKKPIEIMKAEGNPGKRELPETPDFPQGTPKCPDWLSPEAKKFWKRLVPILESVDGLLRQSDLTALESLCETYSQWKTASLVLQKEGQTITANSGYVQQRPEVAIAQKTGKMVMEYLGAFGLTPSSRARLGIKPEPKGDGFDDF